MNREERLELRLQGDAAYTTTRRFVHSNSESGGLFRMSSSKSGTSSNSGTAAGGAVGGGGKNNFNKSRTASTNALLANNKYADLTNVVVANGEIQQMLEKKRAKTREHLERQRELRRIEREKDDAEKYIPDPKKAPQVRCEPFDRAIHHRKLTCVLCPLLLGGCAVYSIFVLAT